MANPEHLEILQQGPDVWNKWRMETSDVPDLREAKLLDMKLNGADFKNADLRGANLRSTHLFEADFLFANLEGATLNWALMHGAMLHQTNLSSSELIGTDLIFAMMVGANLRGAQLYKTDLSHSLLSFADFTDVAMGQVRFGNVDLREVKGLETIDHQLPSSIGIDTIYRSRGEIPKSFLQGAGVPDDFIDYMKSLTGKALEFYTCFLSHSSMDLGFCKKLQTDLRAKGVSTWFFPDDARTGRPVWGEIDASIKLYDKLVVVCSRHSLESPAVLREIERALQREDREGKDILFPVTIDDYVFSKWKHPRKDDVVAKVVGDFRDWKDQDRYETAFKRLLKDLKKEQS